MLNTVLKMEDISKRFPGVVALKHATVDLAEGEVHAIIGENGAGKSTLVKIMTGVMQPSDGRIFLDGEEIQWMQRSIREAMMIAQATDDAVISDALNHASLIDGIRLCKAKRLRFAHSDMADLERKLQDSSGSRLRLIVTDGVFSMDGDLAKLDRIVELAERHDAAVMVDDSHATGILGRHGRGTPDHFGVSKQVEIVTSTLGKTLGGAAGGFTTGRAEIVELLRQRSRPYLFSNALPPVIAAGALEAIKLVAGGDALRAALYDNARYFRSQLTTLGFRLIPGEHPIIPVMLGDAALATTMADRLLHEGVYVIGFSYPVVPDGQARIRIQMSAAHSRQQLEQAVAAFAKVGRELGVIP